jgi:hypothetical protein
VPWRASNGVAAIRPKKLRKKAISKVCSDFDANRIATAISPKRSALPSISNAACQYRAP